jgi:AraC family transcriptional regulator of adaptative response / DNA-3-methyladenine glycosylase II
MDIRHVADAYVDECFCRETPPRVSELAHLLGMSRAHLTVLFARQIRESPSAWLKRMQIERSVELMQTTDHSLTRIAYMCGFGTRRTFFRAFRRFHRRSPGTLRVIDRMSLSRKSGRL